MLLTGAAAAPVEEPADLPVLAADMEIHGLGGIAEGDPDDKCSAFSLFARQGDRAVMADHGALCDGKAQACSSDRAGSGFVDAVEALEDAALFLLRDAYAIVMDGELEIFVVSVHCDGHLSVLAVVFDRVFHQVSQNEIDLCLVHLGDHFVFVHQGQFNIPKLRDGAQASEHVIRQFVDVCSGDLQIHVCAVLPDQGQEVGDDLVFPVDLVVDVLQEFPVHSRIDIFLRQERSREHFHGSHGGLELMGDIRDELLPRLVQCVHSAQNIVKSIGNMSGFRIHGGLDRFVGVPLLDLTDIDRELFEGFDQKAGDQYTGNENNDQHDHLERPCLAAENLFGLLDIFRGCARQ